MDPEVTRDGPSEGAVDEQRVAIIAEFLDVAHYSSQVDGSCGSSPELMARHYMQVGWHSNLDPTPTFSTCFYSDFCGDALSPSKDPFSQYLLVGRAAGWPATPSELNRRTLDLGDAFDLISGCVDRGFYVRQFPSLRGTTINAAQHYLLYGWRRGLDPSDDFSTNFYLSRSPDVAAAGINPLHHYLGWGRHEGRAPHRRALSDYSGQISETETLVRQAFDPDFYLKHHPELIARHVNPLKHYIAFGWTMGWDPSPGFSTDFYLGRSPDVRASGMNPLFHFVKWGRSEGRLPSPKSGDYDFEPLTLDDRLIAREFDAAFYRKTYPKIAGTHVDPLRHFIKFGWRQMLDPNADFSMRFYSDSDATLLLNDINPFLHYLRFGISEGRLPGNPGGDRADPHLDSRQVRQAIATEFDYAFYRDAYNLRTLSDQELLDDYLGSTSRDRDPVSWFSTADYSRLYPGSTINGMDPFYHYLSWGRREGLQTFARNDGGVQAVVSPNTILVPSIDLASSWRECAPSLTRTTSISSVLDVHWVIPDLDGAGRGGRTTLLRIVRWLELFGHRCTLWINDPDPARSQQERAELILRAYPLVRASIRLLPESMEFSPEALVVATSWDTAHRIMGIPGGLERFYFVQDYEPAFYPAGSRGLAADASYDFEIGFLCAGSWLAKRIASRGGWVRSFDLAADDRCHQSQSRAPNTLPRIAFYARDHTDRRAVELGFLALEKLAASGVAFQVDLFGNQNAVRQSPFPTLSHGVLAPEELLELYAACDVGLCLSATNYSLIPQEMMACGLPVVEMAGENTLSTFPSDVISLAAAEPQAIANALALLLSDREAREAQAEAGLAWMTGRTWEVSARAVEGALFERLKNTGIEIIQATPALQEIAPPVVTVIIPTFNGGALFREVLEAVERQRAPWPFDILVIDSTSTDGTWEHLLSRGSGVRTTQIEKAAFQHGRTRNLAMEQTTSEFVAFLTQDALPASDFWLYDLVEGLRRHPRAAGAYGRHIPRADASPYTKRDIEAHFAHLAKTPLEVSKYLDVPRWSSGDESWLRTLHFFSDNNACLRRSVWKMVPYPEVDYGEDQLWAFHVIVAGYSKLYVPSAVVYHSHDYEPEQLQERASVDGRFLAEHFGYRSVGNDLVEHVRQMNLGDEVWGVRNNVPRQLIDAKKRLNTIEASARAQGESIGLERRRTHSGAAKPGVTKA